MYLLRFIGVFLALFSVSFLQASRDIETHKMSENTSNSVFQKALESAYQTNSELREALRRYYAAVEDIPQARAGFLPDLRLVGSATQGKTFRDTQSSSSSVATAGAQQDKINNYDLNMAATLSQNFYNGGQTIHGLQAAELNVFAAQQTFINSEQSVLLQAVTAYLDLWRSRETLRARESSEKFNRRALEQITAQAEVGERTRTEVAEAEANLASAISERLTAQADVESAEATYFEVIGQEAPFELPKPKSDFDFSVMPKSLDMMKSQVDTMNPLVLSASFGERAAQKIALQAEGSLKPNLDFTLSGSRNRNNQNINTSESLDPRNNGPSKQLRYTSEGSARLELTIPLYQRGSEWSNIRRRNQEFYQARNTLSRQRKAQRRAAIRAWERWIAFGKSVEQRRIRVRSAELTLEGRRQEYLVGERTLTDVFDAERELTNAQVDLATTIRDHITTGYEVLSLVGGLLPEPLNLGVERYDFVQYTQEQAAAFFGTGNLRIPENVTEPGMSAR